MISSLHLNTIVRWLVQLLLPCAVPVEGRKALPIDFALLVPSLCPVVFLIARPTLWAELEALALPFLLICSAVRPVAELSPVIVPLATLIDFAIAWLVA